MGDLAGWAFPYQRGASVVKNQSRRNGDMRELQILGAHKTPQGVLFVPGLAINKVSPTVRGQAGLVINNAGSDDRPTNPALARCLLRTKLSWCAQTLLLLYFSQA